MYLQYCYLLLIGRLNIIIAQRLKQKLEVLRELDKDFKVFGAESHKYKLRTCLSEAEIQRFELENNITLPEDYRYFLLEIGNGGAGPGYGLHSLKDTYPDKLDQPFPFEITTEIVSHDMLGSPGNLEIVSFGCLYCAVLVVTGKERGNIWLYDEIHYEVVAYSSKKDDRYNFLAWYEQWLDVHINTLRNGKNPDHIWAFGYFGK